MNLQPVILCGGSGTRLWPLSREQHPKQLLAINGDSLSLLQHTARRLDGLALGAAPPAAPLVLTNEEHRYLVAGQLRAIGVEPGAILLEPAGKGTAPALTLAALHALSDGDPLLVVMPSDHVIGARDGLHDAVRRAAALAAEG